MKNLNVINNEVYARPSREDYESEFNEVIRIIKNSTKMTAAYKQQFLSMFNALHEAQTTILDSTDTESICLTPYILMKIHYSHGNI